MTLVLRKDDNFFFILPNPIHIFCPVECMAGDKPVILALNNRVLVPKDNGESEVQFNFVKWERLIKIEVLKEDFKG